MKLFDRLLRGSKKEVFAVSNTDSPGIHALVLLDPNGRGATQLALVAAEYGERVKAAIGQQE